MIRLYLCEYCKMDMGKTDAKYCPKCLKELLAYASEPRSGFPFVAGLSEGPDSGKGANQKPVFSRPDPLRETMRSLSMSERAGKLSSKDVVLAQAKVAALKAQEPFRKKVDYEKDGHPLEGMNT